MTELYSDAFSHAPLLREHSSILFFVVHKLALDPRIASIYLVKPCHLCSVQKAEQTVSEMVQHSYSMYKTHKVTLTSWFSWKSTRYSERCCLMNFLMISCLIRGSRTFATKQASLRTMLGPPDFCKYV